jgi:hypothetical protein
MRFRSFHAALAAVVVLGAGLSGCGGGTTTGIPPGRGGGSSPGSGAPTSVPTSSPTSPGGAVPTASPTSPGGSGSGPSTGPSPGPAALYLPPATAPQLVNTGIWSAPPILVEGASSYRSGEYVYQGFLYDDHGAKGVLDVNQDDEQIAGALSMPSGTYTYPTAPNYGANAANLIEFRLKLTSSATAFRATFNTMIDPTVEAFTIGLGGGSTSYAMPHGANTSEPAQYFITVHGTTADVVSAATGAAVAGAAPTVQVDQTHRQVTVLLPFSTFDPRSNTALRVAVAAGLWNATVGTYLVPGAISSATSPGGAALPSPAAFFDVGFRHAEPAAGDSLDDEITPDTWWRESQQALALVTGSLSSFYDVVDMTKVAGGVNDDMPGQPQGVPQTGHINRILSSHWEPFQGRDFTGCQGLTTACAPEFGSALEPYSIYVPSSPAPSGGYQLTLLLHSLSCNYNQYANTNYESQFANRTVPSIVFTTEGRGPDNWYTGLSEAEVFEVWSDVASRYPINENAVALTGYSMGGFATWKLGARWPDLFGKMQPTVGPPIDAGEDLETMFASYRNIPILSWHASADELVPVTQSVPEEQTLSSLGLNFEWDLFAPAEHLTLALNDQFDTAAVWLGTVSINDNPPHVTYVVQPSLDSSQYDVVATHGYWVSNVATRTASTLTGTIDVLSHGFGVGDPPTSGTQTVIGTLTGGEVSPAIAYTGFKNTYGTPPAEPVADELTVNATNIATVTIAPSRAKVDCSAQLNVTTDGPLAITLAGCTNGTTTYSASKRREATHGMVRRL